MLSLICKFLINFDKIKYNFEKRIIPILTYVDDERAEEVLYHEATHVIWDQTGLAQIPGIQKHWEQITQAYGHGWYQFMKDNRLNIPPRHSLDKKILHLKKLLEDCLAEIETLEGGDEHTSKLINRIKKEIGK